MSVRVGGGEDGGCTSSFNGISHTIHKYVPHVPNPALGSLALEY